MSGQYTREYLAELQGYPLSIKLSLTRQRIREWIHRYGTDGVYVSFSGGKDSTVLLHIVREMYPNVTAVFLDTGLEYPEIRQFVKNTENVVWIRPKMNFREVIEQYGYPFISKEISCIVGGGQQTLKILKDDGVDINDRQAVAEEIKKRLGREHGEWRRLAQCLGMLTKENEVSADVGKEQKGMYSDIPQKYKFLLGANFRVSAKCCDIMKKNGAKEFEKETGKRAITAQMTYESRLRKQQWLKSGCNAFEAKRQISNPMSFWLEQDVLNYIKNNGIEIASVYGKIVTDDDQIDGQMSIEDYGLGETYKRLKTTGRRRTGCIFCGYGCHMEAEGEGRFERLKITHPKVYDYLMRPWEQGGLNYKEVIDWLNEHGNLNIRY